MTQRNRFSNTKRISYTGYDKETIKSILTIDFIERKRKKWILYPICKWNQFYKYTVRSRPSIRPELDVCLTTFDNRIVKDVPELPLVRKFLKSNYPMAQNILDKFHGNLALCGGFYSHLMSEVKTECCVNDLDFFFYNCNKEQANAIMEESIIMICSHFADSEFAEIKIERRQNVTTVIIMPEGQPYTRLKYQFIHRIYPRLDSIIGGFDIGASMIAYDGANSYATAMGAWSLINRTNIADISRRSTTFTKRLVKYERRGFRIVLPGLNCDVFEKYTVNLDFDEQIAKLRLEIGKLQLVYTPDGWIGENPLRDQFRLNTGHKVGRLFINQDKNHISIRNRWILNHENPTEYKTRNYNYEAHFPDINIPRLNASLVKKGFFDAITSILCWKRPKSFPMIGHINSGSLYPWRIHDEKLIIMKEDNAEIDIKNEDNKKKNEKHEELKNLITQKNYIRNKYRDMIENPVIDFELDFGQVGEYPNCPRVMARVTNRTNSNNVQSNGFEGRIEYSRPAKENSWYPIYTPEEQKDIDPNRVYREDLNQYPVINGKLVWPAYMQWVPGALCSAYENLKGNTWIEQDPGRQWTASINPLDSDYKNFYSLNCTEFDEGKCLWNGFIVGIPPELETVCRLIFKKHGIPRNLIDYIFPFIITAIM